MTAFPTDILASDLRMELQPPPGGAAHAPISPRAAEDAETARAQATFAGVLSRLRKGPAQTEAELKARARDAAEDFIAMSLVQPILAHLREHPLVDPEQMGPLAPGMGEKMLQPLWDAQTAREIVRGAGWPMVDQLAAQLLQRAGASNSSACREVDRHA